MATKFTVIGDGAMGTACAILLSQQPSHDVTIWCQFTENCRSMNEHRENVKFLPGVHLPDNIVVTDDFEAARNVDAFVVAVPTPFLRKTLEGLAAKWPKGPSIVSVVKGMEQETFQSPSQIITQIFGERLVAALSGPSHAEEIARGLPASVVAASGDWRLAQQVQQWFTTERFRVYSTHDVVGTELGGALKNVIAIAAGICDGLGFGDNAKSALMTRGLVEMVRFGVAMGAEAETFYGLAGMGDLITTCVSDHGRNRRVGQWLAEGKTLEQIQQLSEQVAEGVFTSRSVHDLAAKKGIEMPVTDEVYRILFENKNPMQAVDDLMSRDPKPERA